MIKRITALFGAATMFVALFGVFPTTGTAYAEETLKTEDLYYEAVNDELTFTAEGTSLTSAKVELYGIDSADIPRTLELDANYCVAKGSEVTLKKLNDKKSTEGTDATAMVLGKEYKLTFTVGVKEYVVNFTYVTKAIRTAEDFNVFDIKDESTRIEGYYVLLNDIDISNELVPTHKGYVGSVGSGKESDEGFHGTFDGLGHSICAHMTSKNTYGLFGRILGGAIIRNVGFIDIEVNSCPIIALQSYSTWGNQSYIENVYVRTSINSNLPKGAILGSGGVWCNVYNVVIDVPGKNVNTDLMTWGSFGALYGGDLNKKDELKGRDDHLKNVYVIANMPLVYCRPGAATAQGQGGWYECFGGNEGVQSDPENGIHVYTTVKKYTDAFAMIKDAPNNDYTQFDTRYWDFSLGMPVWKSAVETVAKDLYGLFVKTNGKVYSKTIHLTLDGVKDYVDVFYGGDGVAIEGYDVSLTVTEGEEFVKVEGNKIVGVAVGKSRVHAIVTNDGKTIFEQDYVIKVMEDASITPNEPSDGNTDNDVQNPVDDVPGGDNSGSTEKPSNGGSSCGASTVGGTGLTVAAALTTAAVAVAGKRKF